MLRSRRARGEVPLLDLNSLGTQTERSRQKGLADGLRAVFAAARNPTAHEPKVLSTLSEVDALDHLTQVSYLHRRLDECTSTAHVRAGPDRLSADWCRGRVRRYGAQRSCARRRR